MATKAKKTAPKKRVAAKSPAAKKSAKKKSPVKKAVTKKAAKKAAPKKKAVTTKKKATPRRQPVATPEKRAKKAAPKPKEKATSPAPQVQGIQQTDTPVVEGNAQVVEMNRNPMPVPDKKSLQRGADRNYQNHHMSLSSHKKGGPKPSGKKPLW